MHSETNNWVYFSQNHSLCNPEPHLLEPVSRETLGPYNSIQRRLASVDVCLRRFAPVSALEYFPEEEETEVDWDLILLSAHEDCRFKENELTPM